MAGSPLLGFNHNVRHLGNEFHIQTEDSGTAHGHIFTHLFADGGRIIASKKTTYKKFIGTPRYPDAVMQLMRESHKAMIIALRDGVFDEDEVEGAKAFAKVPVTLPGEAPEAAPPAAPAKAVAPEPAAKLPAVDEAALEAAASAKLASSPASRAAAEPPKAPPPRSAGRYQRTQRATGKSRPAAARPDPSAESIFGGDLLSEKSLDEVILSYLAEDADD